MHRKADMKQWQGRIDAAEGELGMRWHQVVRPFEQAAGGPGVGLVGFACDAGVARNQGRTGAEGGPAALRAMLANMPVRRCKSIADAGDISCDPSDNGDGLEEAQDELSAAVAVVLASGKLAIALGGGHEIAFGSFGGLARHLAGNATKPRIGILNLDAHFDLRMDARASSGTPFRQIAEECQARGWAFNYCCLGVSAFANTEALFQRADALGVTWRLDEDMGVMQLDETLATVSSFLAGVDHLYLTVCLDVLPAAVAPGVSAPAARGVPLDVIEPIVDAAAASGKLRLADVAELNPGRDIDNRTARVAARLVARIAERAAV
ncbi:formimidoylglutamase [Noviherbaspirillum sp.]|uniref:formimidoylglutamase n=1 Tax=Noviherbaspirillum sp. TaxID=1926288 RepID=UPI002D4A8CE3|nr:formimidoylglutamase [Noviherbaspirillum sp.]HZW21932.1 formimidoylglutamase [Noviherbaspirillum sp.]